MILKSKLTSNTFYTEQIEFISIINTGDKSMPKMWTKRFVHLFYTYPPLSHISHTVKFNEITCTRLIALLSHHNIYDHLISGNYSENHKHSLTKCTKTDKINNDSAHNICFKLCWCIGFLLVILKDSSVEWNEKVQRKFEENFWSTYLMTWLKPKKRDYFNQKNNSNEKFIFIFICVK